MKPQATCNKATKLKQAAFKNNIYTTIGVVSFILFVSSVDSVVDYILTLFGV